MGKTLRGSIGSRYLLFLLGVVASRIIVQTDVVILSRISESGLFAYGASSSIMFINSVLGLSWIPIVSTSVAGLDASAKPKIIGDITVFSLFLGLSICVLGLPIYLVILHFSVNAHLILAQKFILLLTLLTPINFLHFTGCFLFHSEGKSHIPLVNYLFMATLNLPMNIILGNILGPIGVVWSTVIGYTIFSIILYWPIVTSMSISLRRSLKWGISKLGHMFWETGRVGVEKIYFFIVFSMLNKLILKNLSTVVGAYTISLSIYLFLSIFSITTLRITPILLARTPKNQMKDRVQWGIITLGIPPLIGVIISLGRKIILGLYGARKVSTFQIWSNPFFDILPLLLLLDSVISRLVGEMHFMKNYRSLALQKFLITFIFETPIAFGGIYTQRPYLFWGSKIVAQIFLVFILILHTRKIRGHK